MQSVDGAGVAHGEVGGGERYYGPTSKPLLDSVQSPADMKRFTIAELKQLAYELRWETLEVRETGERERVACHGKSAAGPARANYSCSAALLPSVLRSVSLQEQRMEMPSMVYVEESALSGACRCLRCGFMKCVCRKLCFVGLVLAAFFLSPPL